MNSKAFFLAAGAALILTASTAARADMDTQRRFTTTETNRMKEDQQREQQESQQGHGPQMSMAMSKAIKQVMDAANKKDWPTAKGHLVEAQAIPNPSDFDSLQLAEVTAFVAFGTKDTETGYANYKKAIANPLFDTAVSKADQTGMLKNTMMLSNAHGDYAGTIALSQKLIAVGGVDDIAAITLALAYYNTNEFQKAKDWAQKALDAEGSTPNPTAREIVDKSKAAGAK